VQWGKDRVTLPTNGDTTEAPKKKTGNAKAMKEDNTEKAILEAAQTEFAEKGFHGARMQTIADRAGTNKALLHYYFRSKEQLYIKSLEPIGNAFRTAVEPQVQQLAPGDLRGLAHILASFAVTEGQRAPHSRMLITELATGGTHLLNMGQAFTDSMTGLQRTVLAFIRDGIDRGMIKPYHPMKIFNNLMGMCWNIFLLAPMADIVFEESGVVRDDAFYDDYIRLIEEMAAGLEIPTR
jgi:TetR/AcrR family transcriptional regulator